MTFHLRVASSLDPLVDELVEILARPFTDPFVPEVIAVPGDGVRAWLIRRLAERLGPPGAGVVANIEFVYPAEIVRRALGDQEDAGSWGVGPLTWLIHAVLQEHGDELGQPTGLLRARAIADLFDRYTLHRPAMVTAWGVGRDVDAADQTLAPDHLWQPRLWRLVRDRLGGTSDAERTARAALDLAVGRLEPQLPERVVLFGLASMPSPHLRVVAALSRSIDVHVLAPVPSHALWNQLRALPAEPLRLPLDRRDDPSAHLGRHPLLTSWGRAAREAHLLLLDATREVPADVSAIEPGSPTAGEGDTSLLARLQRAVETDVAPSPDDRPVLAADDRSVEWHRCHGPARQVEVLRDIVLHLLEETDADGSPRFEPRDIAVLCPDVPTFAPFAQAAFAGDPENGVPAVPLRVADRSLRADNPLLDAVGALLQLVGGRLSATDVLATLALAPVRRRFGLDTERLERIGSWVRSTNVRWGLDVDHRAQYGLPPTVVAHTWRSALDQLLLGATMADTGPRLGLGGTVPFGDVEGDDVETAGVLAEIVEHLAASVGSLSVVGDPMVWFDALAVATRQLFSVADDDGHLWRDLDRVLTGVREEVGAVAAPSSVAGHELASLILERLSSSGGNPRFGTGAVTVSSLTAQRGVPFRVVCLIGLDGDLGAGGVAQSDDLSAVPACLGDRDQRSELRAQLLDAVRAAGDRLVLISTGHDVRTNADVAPAVALAEFLDVIDATVRSPDPARRATAQLAVSHPRQAWSIRTVVRGALRPEGPWSFDRGVLSSVVTDGERPVESPTRLLLAAEPDLVHVSLTDLFGVAQNPVKALLSGRLGVWLDKDVDSADDLIPIDTTGLDLWRVCDALLQARQAAGAEWDENRQMTWTDVQRAIGAVPPLELGRDALRVADQRIEAILALRDEALGAGTLALTTTESIDVTVTVDGIDRRVVGQLDGVSGSTTVSVSASRPQRVTTLETWITAAALAVHVGGAARAVTIRRNEVKRASDPPAIGLVVDVASADDGRRALVLWVDLLLRARRCVAPVLPDSSYALVHGRGDEVYQAWTGKVVPGWRASGDMRDPWVSFVLPGLSYDDLVTIPVVSGEVGDDWPDVPGRFECWSRRIWDGFASLCTSHTIPEVGR